jgi:hypothetical protein
MNDELNTLISDLEKISVDAKSDFGDLSVEQINWKPSAKSWSVGQCLDHLIEANCRMLAKAEPIIHGKHNPTFFERLPLVSKFFGKLVLGAVDPKTVRKTKNPGIFDPAKSDLEVDVIEKFVAEQEKIIAAMKASEGVDLERTIMTSPVAVFVTYSVFDAFRIITAHEKRHFQQAKRVVKTEGSRFKGEREHFIFRREGGNK